MRAEYAAALTNFLLILLVVIAPRGWCCAFTAASRPDSGAF
jgi:hypothetical protein